MSKSCPSCRTVVDDDAAVCPNCPWIFPDEMTSARMEKTVPAPWSPLPMLILAGVALAIAGGWIVFVKTVRHSDREPTAAPQSAPAAIQEAPAPMAAKAEPRPAPPSVAAQPEAAEAATPPPPPAAVPATPAQKPLPPVKEWRLRGHVYDLMTLRPVARCAIILSDLETDAHFETATDDAGLYRAILPPLPGRGYSVGVTHTNHAATYLDPAVLEVPRMPIEVRRNLCRELATAVRGPITLQPLGSSPLVTDFYLAPLSCL